MTSLVLTVFAASLMGSLHCAGMCGAFVAFALGIDGPRNLRMHAALQTSYHLGRLIVYMVLGGLSGSFGYAFDLAGEMMGVQRAAVVLAGAAMVAFGSLTIARINGVRLPAAPIPAFIRSGAASALRFAVERPPLLRALLTGLFTTLLPCGWLYAFVITAAGSGSAASGALIMGVFWTGTLPVLVALGGGVQAIAGRLSCFGPRIPLIAASLIVAVGLFTVFNRGPARFGHAGATPGDASIRRVSSLHLQEMPCCHEHADR